MNDMNLFPKILAATALAAMVAPAQQQEEQADAAATLESVMERLAADDVLVRSAGWTPVDTRRRVGAMRSHLGAVKQGEESLKDYAWLTETLHLYYDKGKKRPPVELVQQLLKAGADVNARDDRGRTALFYHCGSPEVAKLLLDAGADVNAAARGNRTPIYTALGKKDLAVLDLFIAAGADLNVRDDTGATPLFENMCGGADAVTLRLIAAGADVNVRTRTGKSAVGLALESNNSDIMIEMMRAGAQLDVSEYSPLFQACFYGRLEEVQRMIDEGADILAPFKDGSTPLMLAARIGNVELCRLLLEAGADVGAESDSSISALHIAARENRPRACETLIAAGVAADLRSKDGSTPLAMAIEQGSSEAVDALLKAGAQLNTLCNAEPLLFKAVSGDSEAGLAMLQKLIAAGADLDLRAQGSGESVLHRAAANDRQDVCDALIAAGMNINTTDALGNTPLAYAVRRESIEMCRRLLAAGADLNAGENGGIKMFRPYGLRKETEQIFRLLLDAGMRADSSPQESKIFFLFFVHERRADLCRELVKVGLQPEGWEPIALAVVLGDAERVKQLLADGADANAKHEPHPLLTLAAHMGHEEVCRVLLDAGAQPEPELAPYAWPPLLAAVEAGNPDIARLLLAAGAKAELPEPFGTNILYRAARRGNLELCRLLQEAGADANAPSPGAEDRTPLHAAVTTEDPIPLCRFLIQHGASAAMLDTRGQSPLHVALLSNSRLRLSAPLCQLLIEAGAKTDTKDQEGKSPDDIANEKHRYYFSSNTPGSLPLLR